MGHAVAQSRSNKKKSQGKMINDKEITNDNCTEEFNWDSLRLRWLEEFAVETLSDQSEPLE